jgi:PAS domain S-box-containing protein
VESSPAAILTLDHSAQVLAANRAAHDLLGVEQGKLLGMPIGAHVPVFAGAMRAHKGAGPLRVSATSWARRADGTQFPIATWFSTYGENGERRLAGIFVDESEEVRDRERQAFEQLAEHDRLLASAVSHEIRNLTLAIRVVTLNLERKHNFQDDEDFDALVTMVASLSKIASYELHRGIVGATPVASLRKVLDHLRIVIEPDWAEVEGEVQWPSSQEDFKVRAEEHALLQVFLNLSQNSLRAMQRMNGNGERRLEVWEQRQGESVMVSFVDSGPGVQDPAKLFRAFQEGSEGSGLGLFISRTMLRSFDGDLIHVPQEAGCRFDVLLPLEKG